MSEGAAGRFESAFAAWFGVGRAFAFWRGRVALYAILRAMGVGEGDEVIVTGYTCTAAVRPIKFVGARPVYVDIEPRTYCMDPERIEPAISRRTRLIVAQHTYGYPAEMDAILDVAGRHGLPVVEDSCLALGSRYKGRLCGTMGLAGYFSFQWNKPFTTGIGGMVITRDADLAGRIESLCRAELRRPPARRAIMLGLQRTVYRAAIWPRTTALATRLYRWLTARGLVVGSYAKAELTARVSPDFFAGMSPGQGRAGLRGIANLGRNLAHRRRMKAIYEELLGEAGFDVPSPPAWCEPVLVRYPVRVADKARAVAEAPGRAIELGTWFECVLHPSGTPMELYDYRAGMCPVGERAAAEVVNLPLHPRAGRSAAIRSVEFVRSIGSACAPRAGGRSGP